jgi:uncharacterized UBP type Zn finger protein
MAKIEASLNLLLRLSLLWFPNRYCPKGSETAAISPQMFKFLVGKGHPEFSTGNQQDAYEYLQHLLKVTRYALHPPNRHQCTRT